ncbi:unnamed protein product [Notodromas monacha]|uniref:RNA helicase n=1 Tax=Notodromas monacha TaxID=399045 RepID=A0A7R9BRQ8_9CRUS|nr:unnamed protein product [Notodromas monacha]CAG0919397.1 unnamed protein product [Notodromas monacha]
MAGWFWPGDEIPRSLSERHQIGESFGLDQAITNVSRFEKELDLAEPNGGVDYVWNECNNDRLSVPISNVDHGVVLKEKNFFAEEPTFGDTAERNAFSRKSDESTAFNYRNPVERSISSEETKISAPADDSSNNEPETSNPVVSAPTQTYVPPQITEEQLNSTPMLHAGSNLWRMQQTKVTCHGHLVPAPVDKISETQLHSFVAERLGELGFDELLPVQKFGIPIGLAGRDLVATAQTGSGKTVAFLAPVLHYLMTERPACGSGRQVKIKALILTPTRELALQIGVEILRLTRGSEIKTNMLYGGTSVKHMWGQVSRGTHILVGTPGRVKAHVDWKQLDFSECRFLVLDEADQMLDLGFSADIDVILNSAHNGHRQTLMFSATFPANVKEMAAKYLKPDHVFMAVGVVGGANEDIQQKVVQVPRGKKMDTLFQVLCDHEGQSGKTLIFTATKKTADFLALRLSASKFVSTSIHGDRCQEDRETAMRHFRLGDAQYLVATSVAARGLDIPEVAHVINYDLPTNIDEYVHRIGRTGRIGNAGKATSFFDPEKDYGLLNDLVNTLAAANQEVPDFLQSGDRNYNAVAEPVKEDLW